MILSPCAQKIRKLLRIPKTTVLQWPSVRKIFKLYFQVSRNSQYIYPKNTQLSFVRKRFKLHFKFFRMFRDSCDMMDLAQSQKILAGSTRDCVAKSLNITAILQYFRKSNCSLDLFIM